jgi:hypothetical protein
MTYVKFNTLDVSLHDTKPVIVDRDLAVSMLTLRGIPTRPTRPTRPSDALREAAERDLKALQERWEKLGELLEGGASVREVELSLRPIVRRLCLSPRFRPVLEERLLSPELPTEAPAERPADAQ